MEAIKRKRGINYYYYYVLWKILFSQHLHPEKNPTYKVMQKASLTETVIISEEVKEVLPHSDQFSAQNVIKRLPMVNSPSPFCLSFEEKEYDN